MHSSIFFVSCCVVVGSIVACASPTVPDDGLAEGDDTSGTSGSTKKPTTKGKDAGASSPIPASPAADASSPSADAAGATPTGACAAPGNQDACFTCCETANPKALPILDNAFGSCACVTPGACATSCAASFCAGKEPTQGDACDMCLTANDMTCGAQADTACAASADCKPLFACDDAAQCASRAP